MSRIEVFEGMPGIEKFGYNADVDAFSTPVDIVTGDVTYLGFGLSTAAASITGGAADDSGGTGALTVYIEGLDEDYAVQSEIATMSGATPKALAKTYRAIHRAYVITSGSDGTNNALITIKILTVEVAWIGAGVGQTQQAAYIVPSVDGFGNTIRHAHIYHWSGSVTNNVSVALALSLMVKNPAESWRQRRITGISSVGTSSFDHDIHHAIKCEPQTQIKVRAIDASADSVGVDAEFIVAFQL